MAQFPANIDLSSLNGANGFRLSGAAAGDRSGWSVASAGDVNGDGFDDMIVGSPEADPHGSGSGASYVAFGKASVFAANLDLSSLNGSNGFRLSGVAANEASGDSVASAGDVNGDGFDDMIVGSRGRSGGVVFGKASGFAANINLSSLNGSNGFRIVTANNIRSVASAGDVNGDGFDDLIVGTPFAGPSGTYSGASYVVFGKASGFGPSFDLSSLDGANGFRLSGATPPGYSGYSVASAGDVNGDGFDDLIVGAPGADVLGRYLGVSYVVFGKASGFAANIDLSSLDGSNGFKLSGVTPGDDCSFSVASAGDVNGDGFADMIVGARGARVGGIIPGVSYVVFGKASGFAANIDLSSLDGSNGFRLSGAAAGNSCGYSVASAGDVNGDGFADMIIGAPYASPHGFRSGASYVVFGKASGFGANIDLSSLDGSNGFKLSGVAAGDYSGRSVASAGDVNGDGFADLIVGTSNGSGYNISAGASYVIYGRAPDTAVVRIGTAASQTLAGGAFDDTLSGLAGDDNLFGNGGNDRLNGGAGDDVLDGGAGNDTLIGNLGLDTVRYASAGAGITLNLALASAQDTGGAGVDTLQTIENAVGSAFDDVLAGSTRANRVEGLSGNDKLRGGGGDDRLEGGGGNDQLLGGLGNDRLEGSSGNDELNGGAGNDIMVGGNGNDIYYVSNALDVVEETGDGFDRISTSIDYTLAAGQAIEFLSGRGTADLTLTGNAIRNTIWGSAGNDTLSGAGGDDSLRGKGGGDTLFGGTGNDILEGGDGADLFRYRLGDSNDRFTDFSGASGDRVALVDVTVSQLVNNIATLSDGSILTAQTGYAWAASDFMPV